MAEQGTIASSPRVTFDRAADASILTVRISGEWQLHFATAARQSYDSVFDAAPQPRRVSFDTSALRAWGSGLVAYLEGLIAACDRRRIAVDRAGLPEGVRRLLALAEAVPEAAGARGVRIRHRLVERVGMISIGYGQSVREFLEFIGDVMIAFGRMMSGRARFRRLDLMVALKQCGADALGIVALISYLVGIILAFMGAVQLQQFGAQIYVADLVGIGVTREMGAMMTAIIMAGRTGAAFAAALGTMKVTQEIDALATIGLSPLEFLVLPRMIALILMMPLLCLYADVVAILGGATIGSLMLGISPQIFLRQTAHAVTWGYIVGGLVKSVVYGVLVSFAGCLRGFQCGSSSSAVGDAAMAAVVTGIVLIVVACGIFAFVYHALGI
jgi:phospholipid/cholesterol/gamma-HCH transport system permease protein